MNKFHLFRLFWLFLPVLGSLLAAFFFYFGTLRDESAVETAQPSLPPKALTPELLRQIHAAQMGGGAAEPTPQQLEEEQQVEREQINAARASLNEADPEQRISGAEQLSAYPTPEAEKLLTESLANDLSSEVRAAAAESLDSFEKLDENTVQALLTALEDPDEDVRENALGTLQGVRDRLEGDGKIKGAKKILAGLKRKSKSPQVPAETQREIKDYLSDLQ